MRSNQLAAAALVGVGAAAASGSDDNSTAALVGIGATALAFLATEGRGHDHRYEDRRDRRPCDQVPGLCLGIDQSWRLVPTLPPCPSPCACHCQGCLR